MGTHQNRVNNSSKSYRRLPRGNKLRLRQLTEISAQIELQLLRGCGRPCTAPFGESSGENMLTGLIEDGSQSIVGSFL